MWAPATRMRRAGIGVLILLLSCAEPDPLLPPKGELSGPRRQVVLVTIDTLRTSHLGAYGYSRDTSPFIDGLAREGVQLMRAYAPAPATVPSHMSMFTGLPPHVHGATRNYGAIYRDDVPSLPTFLRRRGYETAAFISVKFLDPRARRLPGFAHVECPPNGGQWSADETFQRAAAWVAAHADEPLLVWLHAYEPHRPYEPPRPYDTMFWSDAPVDYVPPRTGFVTGAPPTAREAAFQRAMYDGEIRYTDSALRAFFETLQGVWPEPPLVIITADHGEVLEEHAADMRLAYTHGKWPFNQALSVPFIVHWPGHLAPGRRSVPVDITGLAATIASLVSEDEFESAAPSVAAVVKGEPMGSEALFAFSTNVGRRSKFVRGREFRLHESWSILRWPWHLIYNPVRGSQLFHVETDPLELEDLAAAEPGRVTALEAEVTRHFSTLPRARPAEGPVNERLLQQLRKLGYIE